MWLGGGGLELVEDVVEGLGQTGKCAGGVVAADDYTTHDELPGCAVSV